MLLESYRLEIFNSNLKLFFFRWSPDIGIADTGLTACENAYRKETGK